MAVLDTMDFVEANCEKELSLESLAKRVDISPFHFHRLFRAYAGQSLGEFIRQTRLQKGARLLKGTRQKVISVSIECGYKSHEAFSRAFRNWYGVSPSQNQGECPRCTHCREVVSGKGSRFLLCEMSKTDQRFPKYPPQPVRNCLGFSAKP